MKKMQKEKSVVRLCGVGGKGGNTTSVFWRRTFYYLLTYSAVRFSSLCYHVFLLFYVAGFHTTQADGGEVPCPDQR